MNCLRQHVAIMFVLAAIALVVVGVLTNAEQTAAVNPVPCPTSVPVATATPDGGPTYTPSPTHTPCIIKLTSTPSPVATTPYTPTPTSDRPPANPQIDLTVNGEDGPISVTEGESVTYRWVVTNAGDRAMEATVDDDTYDALDAECVFVIPSGTCEQTLVVPFSTPGSVMNTTVVSAVGIPPSGVGQVTASDFAVVIIEAATPEAVGGVSQLPELNGLPLEAADSTSRGVGALGGIAFGVTAGSIGLSVAVWGARRLRG